MVKREPPKDVPSQQDLVAFAREYVKAYLETVKGKNPGAVPPFAQNAPYLCETVLLPNLCFALVFHRANEMTFVARAQEWEEIQEELIKGVDFFLPFYPFESWKIADAVNRGRRDAIRDMRLAAAADLAKTAGQIDAVIDQLNRMIQVNPWLGKTGHEQVRQLQEIEERIKTPQPTTDPIALLQDLKAYTEPPPHKLVFEFPDRKLLESLADGVEKLTALEPRIDAVDQKATELEQRILGMPDLVHREEFDQRSDRVQKRIETLENQLEKVSNILTLLNSKVENYFSMAAEAERQADHERRLAELQGRAEELAGLTAKLQANASDFSERLIQSLEKLEKDLHDARIRLGRVEQHFVDFARMVGEHEQKSK